MSGTPAAQAPTAQPFVLDGRPGTSACRPPSVAVEGRALGACCFAGKLRSPAGPGLGPPVAEAVDPYASRYASPYASPYAGHPRTPSPPRRRVRPGHAPRGASRPQKPRPTSPPRGSGAARPSGALRAIDSSACPRSWRTCGPRRLRRQSKPALVATEGGRGGAAVLSRDWVGSSGEPVDVVRSGDAAVAGARRRAVGSAAPRSVESVAGECAMCDERGILPLFSTRWLRGGCQWSSSTRVPPGRASSSRQQLVAAHEHGGWFWI
jgi:hypothetical protein